MKFFKIIKFFKKENKSCWPLEIYLSISIFLSVHARTVYRSSLLSLSLTSVSSVKKAGESTWESCDLSVYCSCTKRVMLG